MRLYPPKTVTAVIKGSDIAYGRVQEMKAVNQYNQTFFRWHLAAYDDHLTPEFSYSSCFFYHKGVSIHCLKLYPVSPHLSEDYIVKFAAFIRARKGKFDAWNESKVLCR